LDAFPTGAAVSPDDNTVVSLAGGPATTSTDPVATYAVDVTDAATGALKQVIHVRDGFQTVTYSRDGQTLYAAGGGQGLVDVFSVGSTGMLSGPSTLTVPGCSFVSGFALAPDARSVWVACPSDGRVVNLGLPAGTALASVAVPHPDQLAIAPDGHTVYATDWKGDTVAAVDTASHAVSEITVGAAPEGIVALPDGRVVVADSNDATIATIMPATDRVEFSSVGIVGRATDSPSAIAVGPNGRIYVTLAQDNAVAVLSSGSDPGRWRIDGLIPVAWYPTAVALSADGGQLYVVCSEGLGHSTSATPPHWPTTPVWSGAPRPCGDPEDRRRSPRAQPVRSSTSSTSPVRTSSTTPIWGTFGQDRARRWPCSGAP
jgi:YVTN family beta-propeller protein